LGMLEPETATRWLDECLVTECDISQISWVLTANTTADIPEPLLSRLRIERVGALDPYFDAQANVALFLDTEGETQVELEEALLRTQSPAGVPELKAGHYFTEFGAFNPQHLHDWDWLDQPIVATRMFGPDGMRGI